MLNRSYFLIRSLNTFLVETKLLASPRLAPTSRESFVTIDAKLASVADDSIGLSASLVNEEFKNARLALSGLAPAPQRNLAKLRWMLMQLKLWSA